MKKLFLAIASVIFMSQNALCLVFPTRIGEKFVVHDLSDPSKTFEGQLVASNIEKSDGSIYIKNPRVRIFSWSFGLDVDAQILGHDQSGNVLCQENFNLKFGNVGQIGVFSGGVIVQLKIEQNKMVGYATKGSSNGGSWIYVHETMSCDNTQIIEGE